MARGVGLLRPSILILAGILATGVPVQRGSADPPPPSLEPATRTYVDTMLEEHAREANEASDESVVRDLGYFEDAAGARRDISITMQRLGRAAIIAQCEKGCDLDLVVVGPDRDVVARDVMEDGDPFVEFVEDLGGTYVAQMLINRCPQASCVYRVRIVERPFDESE
jgi:hypothetical protein